MSRKLLNIFLILCSFQTFAQQAIVEMGKNKIKISEVFTFKLILKTAEATRPNITFPEIEGFTKAERPVTTTISVLNGQKEFTHTYTQKYKPSADGIFKLKSGEILVGNTKVAFSEQNISVLDPNKVVVQEPIENLSPKASLKLIVEPKSVFVGEPFKVKLVFTIGADNKANLSFPANASSQIQEQLSRVHPSNSIEYRGELKDVVEEKKQVNGKIIKVYQLFETSFIPQKKGNLQIQALTFVMDDLQKQANGTDKKGSLTFKTTEENVTVKAIPKVENRANVVVGDFEMQESISKSMATVAENIEYKVKITGKGEFKLINLPEFKNDLHFDFYPIIVDDRALNSNGLEGSKVFQYNFVAKTNGTKKMSDYFNFVFFNTRTQKLDTLSPKQIISVSGKNLKQSSSKVEEKIESKASIYDGIDQIESSSDYFDFYDFTRKASNVSALFLCLGLFVLALIKTKQ